ncbi:hypothetical protein [uncultured Mediterranean phage uvMED]|nr:hypothetical protein [uncultured Mediterranean phage uvMED]
MNITTAKYDDPEGSGFKNVIVATIDGVESWVPNDPTNAHYAEIMKQVEAGELTIEEADSE